MLFSRISLLMVTFTLLFSAAVSADENYASVIKRFQASPVAQPFFNDSYGYAIFPTVGKGGVGIGGAYGSGQVYRQGKVVGNTKLFKVSWGLQLGGQAFSQVIFLKDKRAFDEFTQGSFEFDATASAVAITAGAQAQAGTKGTTAGASTSPNSGKQLGASYVNGYAVFTNVLGGLMYEAAIAGQKFSYKPL
jgi:lipid-binding SYLF domain-containing protein